MIRRRRRSTTQSKRKSTRIDIRMQRRVTLGMAALAVLFGSYQMRALYKANRDMGMVSINNSRQEVRYVLGLPNLPAVDAAVALQQPEWKYQLPEGGIYRVRFDAGSDRVISTVCEDPAMNAYSCPPRFGLMPGTYENAIWDRLGRPTREQYDGDIKTIAYDDLGLKFTLRRIALLRTQTVKDRDPLGFVWRWFRFILP